MKDKDIMAQGHSGTVTPNNSSEGPGITLEDTEFNKLNDLWNLESNELRKIAEISLQLDEVKRSALASRKERDEYCMVLERKYDIQRGAKWDLDFENKAIVVKKANTISLAKPSQ